MYITFEIFYKTLGSETGVLGGVPTAKLVPGPSLEYIAWVPLYPVRYMEYITPPPCYIFQGRTGY